MGIQNSPDFILIDDDIINNTIDALMIKKLSEDAEITTFDIPEKALNFIIKKYSNTVNEEPAIVFLDINMPIWTGWDFLRHFEELSKNIKNQIKIYMLSSSLDPRDFEEAKKHRYVIDYIVKPLTCEKISEILSDISSLNSQII